MSLPIRTFAIVLALALAGCQRGPAPEASSATETPASPATAAAEPAAIAPAEKPDHPSLDVATFDGGRFNLAEHRGRWVVVNFWATWCTPCLKEIPDLDAFDREREDVDVIGLAYEEIERADMEAFLKEHPMSYPLALLDVYNPPADFDTPRGLPMTYLIDPEGKVAKKFFGPTTAHDLAQLIDAAGRPAPGP